MGSAEEPVDLVDQNDVVIGVLTRREMRAQRARHRTVFIVVRSSAGDVLVHRRADHKDVWPGRWDLAAGGVVGSGEMYDEAAVRELAEELGIEGVALRRLGRGAYEDAEVAEIAVVYTADWDGPVRFADGEVAAAEWLSPRDLAVAIRERSFVPDSIALVLPLL